MTEQEKSDGLQKLRESFPANAISTRPQGGVNLSYVGHAGVTDRLLNVDPCWSWEPFAVDGYGSPIVDRDEAGKPVGLWIKLTVCGVTRPGYGSCMASKAEPMKELIGDALRNAAMRFGVALDLWAKGELESGHAIDTGTAQPSQPAIIRNQAQQSVQRNNPPTQNTAAGCPKCGGQMWDNREKKANGQMAATAPDFKCKNKEGCDGVIWPPRQNNGPDPRAVNAPADTRKSHAAALAAGYADSGDDFDNALTPAQWQAQQSLNVGPPDGAYPVN